MKLMFKTNLIIGFLLISLLCIVTSCDKENLDQVITEEPEATVVACDSIAVFLFAEGTTLNSEIYGGTPEYTYEWSNGSTASTTPLDVEGLYGLTITDADGCTASNSYEYAVSLPCDTFELNINSYPDSIGNVVLVANIFGGNGPFTYMWSNGGNTQQISVIDPGIYSVTVTDINGCMAVEHFEVIPGTDCSSLQTTIGIEQDSSMTAPIILTAITIGGTPPYGYQWSTNEFTSSITVDPGAIYQVTVTDQIGCETVNTVEL